MRKILFLLVPTLFAFLILKSCSKEDEDIINIPNINQNNNKEEATVKQYTLIITAGKGGSVSTVGGTYDEGTELTITASPKIGYSFVGWSNGSKDPTISLVLNESVELIASFEIRELETNIFSQNYSFFEENFKSGDIIEFEEVSFKVQNFSVLNDAGWINWVKGQYGIETPLNYIKMIPIDCYESNLIAELFFNSNNGEFLMIRFGNLNFNGDVFHFLQKRFYDQSLGIQFEDNSQAKHFDNTDLLYFNVLDYIKELKEVSFDLYSIDFKKPLGGHYQFISRKTLDITLIKNDTILTNITECEAYFIKAIPEEGFHFDGWINPVLDTINLFPVLDLSLNKSIDVDSKFISKELKGKNIIPSHNCYSESNQIVADDLLNYRGSENFIVWWDKSWYHNNDAKSVLQWAEFTYNKAIEYGMRTLNENARINVYLHHNTEYDTNSDVLPDNWGQGAGICTNNTTIITHPYGIYNSVKKGDEYDLSNFDKIKINSLYPKINVHHEVFHAMQQFGATNNTFPYSGDFGWYMEATADWFEVKYRPHGGVWRFAPYYLLSPHLRLWDFTWSDNIIDKHRYGASLLLFYLEANKIVQEDFFGRSYSSQTRLTPQEYLYKNIPNFKDHFIDFAGRATVIDFAEFDNVVSFSEERLDVLSDILEQIDLQYKARSEEMDVADFRRFELELVDEGTNGEFIPNRKLESWAYQSIKLKSNTENVYKYIFKAAGLLGTEAGVSDYNLVVIKESNGVKTYDKKEIINSRLQYEFLSESSTTYYFTIVNTPEKFTGRDKYDYSIEILKN